jgi:hypothetical protein
MTSVDSLSTYVFKALFVLGCFTETSWTLWSLLCCSQNWVAHATTIVFEDLSWLQAASISLNRTPTGVETPDVIDLRKTQRKEPEKPLYHVSLALLHRHLTCRSKARKQQVFPLRVYFWCCGTTGVFDVGCRFWRRRRNAFSQGPLWVQVTRNIPAHLTFLCKVSVKDAFKS